MSFHRERRGNLSRQRFESRNCRRHALEQDGAGAGNRQHVGYPLQEGMRGAVRYGDGLRAAPYRPLQKPDTHVRVATEEHRDQHVIRAEVTDLVGESRIQQARPRADAMQQVVEVQRQAVAVTAARDKDVRPRGEVPGGGRQPVGHHRTGRLQIGGVPIELFQRGDSR